MENYVHIPNLIKKNTYHSFGRTVENFHRPQTSFQKPILGLRKPHNLKSSKIDIDFDQLHNFFILRIRDKVKGTLPTS